MVWHAKKMEKRFHASGLVKGRMVVGFMQEGKPALNGSGPSKIGLQAFGLGPKENENKIRKQRYSR